jgi:hypothetical protein
LGDYQLFHAEVQDLPRYVSAGSLDLLITDPPYHRQHVPLYGVLADVAAQVLKPGGSLVTMCGQSCLPEILALMTPHLTYQWQFCMLMEGPACTVFQRGVHNHWRSLLWLTCGSVLVGGRYPGTFVGDVFRGEGPDKRFHAWGQGIGIFAALIQRLSHPGELVCDPFCGGGTAGKAALLLGRRFIGLDRDATAIATTERRLASMSFADAVQDQLSMPEAMPLMCRCLYCGNDFPAERKSAEYCNPAHRQAAYRKRRFVTLAAQQPSALSVTPDDVT